MCTNLWLKDIAGFKLKKISKELVNEFNKKYEDMHLEAIKNSLISSIDNQSAFEKASLDFLKAIKLLKSVEDKNEYEDEEPIDPPGSTNDIEEEIETDESETSDSESSLEDINIDFEETIEEASAVADGASIEEEIDTLSYPHNDYKGFGSNDYSIFTT